MSQCLYVLLSLNIPSLIAECQWTNGCLSEKTYAIMWDLFRECDSSWYFEGGGVTPHILTQAVHFKFEGHWKGKLTYGQTHWALNQPTKRSCECFCTRFVLLFWDLVQHMIWPSSRVGPKRHTAADRSLRPRILNLGQFYQPTSPLDRLGSRASHHVSFCNFTFPQETDRNWQLEPRYREFEKLCQPSTVQVPGGQEPQTIFLWLVLITK